uniref:Ymf70 n=1 Tax=Uronema marinum TaxID=35107 RepID=A0A345WJT7_UROMR|nr:ymf70 [Uronema marinum]AXJ93330.1 ymf70 [Uronema marinum]
MFKWLFYYWLNPTDTPAIESKLNLWAYINIRIFKIKVTSQIVYYILGLNNIYMKKLKIFYKNLSFELFYLKLLNYLVLLIILFSLVIFL